MKGKDKKLIRLLYGVFMLIFLTFHFAFSQQTSRGMRPIYKIPPVPDLQNANIGYNDDWALIIGIDDYEYFTDLQTAVKGARDLAKILKEKFSFNAKHIFELYNEKATKDSIEYYLQTYLPNHVKEKDRVLIYFGGHGINYKNKSGYICPFNFKKGMYSTAISMNTIKDVNNLIDAKHVLYLFDSCFSGMVFVRGAIPEIPETEKNYYRLLLQKESRQAITAGEKDQVVQDNGSSGYSPFTYFLIEGLRSNDVVDDYGIIRASRLGDYIREKVSKYTNNQQNPIYDRFQESDNGDFLFWRNDIVLQEFPNVKLKNFGDHSVNLHRYIDRQTQRGKKYFVFIFWDANCPHCHSLMEVLEKSTIPYNAAIVTINCDDPNDSKNIQKARNYIVSHKNFYNLFLFKSGQLETFLHVFKTQALPQTMIVRNDKTIVDIEAGFRSKEYYLSMIRNYIK